MTRKDYVALAAAINAVRIPEAADQFHAGYWCAVRDVANKITETLSADNQRFDRERFLKACGLND